MNEKLTKEDLDFLINLGKKINSQDTRGTQSPLFIIKQKVKVYHEWGGETERKNDQEEGLCDKCEKLADNGEELPDNCNECDPDCFINFDWEDESVIEDSGCFITAEAAQKHIDSNHYHFHKPFTYGVGTWRNPEMKKLLEILSRLGSDDGNVRDSYSI